MLSQGRFMAAVLPIYIVIGELLARVPRWAAGLALLTSCSLMLLYAMQFAAGKTLL